MDHFVFAFKGLRIGSDSFFCVNLTDWVLVAGLHRRGLLCGLITYAGSATKVRHDLYGHMSDKPYRTLDARPSAESLIKPGELVDLIEVTPLSLNDRRIYNLLLENAWDAIDKPVSHIISKAALRGKHNSNDRVGESIERLMSAIVKVSVNWDGGSAIERVQLLGGNTEALRSDGLVEYEIPARLRKIIANSTVFARLQREVMFALSSKYALTLYEMVQKRGNLRWRSSERFSLDALRGILGGAERQTDVMVQPEAARARSVRVRSE